MEENDFVVDLITLEVGSRDFVSYESFYQLREVVGATPKELNDLLVAITLSIKISNQGVLSNLDLPQPPK